MNKCDKETLLDLHITMLDLLKEADSILHMEASADIYARAKVSWLDDMKKALGNGNYMEVYHGTFWTTLEELGILDADGKVAELKDDDDEEEEDSVVLETKENDDDEVYDEVVYVVDENKVGGGSVESQVGRVVEIPIQPEVKKPTTPHSRYTEGWDRVFGRGHKLPHLPGMVKEERELPIIYG